jgi:hypothetical protein
MANFTLETNRNTAIKNIPRLIFQLPQSSNTPIADTISPIYFCQTGCQLEFEFKNLKNATLKNDGNYFTIIPNADSNNYINWNGSGVSGQNMTRFDLKEIKFSAPAKDVVGSITYNKSIQFYFTFVNSTYTNIMIIISIIGQANNVGNALTDGYILLNSLTNQIPLRNETKTVSNLENVNLGNLLPKNKSFFSTLLNDNNLQYIFMTRIIDIPEVFLNNLISRVIGSEKSYESMVNKYTQQIPTNPLGTIIFYTENVGLTGSDQAFVCNSNCDRVVGDAKLLQPTIGSSSTKSEIRSSISSRSLKNVSKKITSEEECEEEYVFPGSTTNVKVNFEPDKSPQQIVSGTVIGTIIGVLIFCMISFSSLIFYVLAQIANVKGLEFFSVKFWGNRENIPWIILTFIGFLAVVICLTISIFAFIEQNSKEDISKRKIKIDFWGLIIIGVCIVVLCIIILFLKLKNLNRIAPLNSKGISNLVTLQNKINQESKSNPYYFQSNSGKANLLKKSELFNKLSPEEKSNFQKYQNSKITQSMQPKLQNSLFSDIDSAKVTDKMKSDIDDLKIANPENKELQEINVNIGGPVPKSLLSILKKYKK